MESATDLLSSYEKMMSDMIHAGAAEVDITPPMGVEMCGYGAYLKRVCIEVLDPLYGRALWLGSSKESLLILTADLCMIDISTRNEVAKALHEKCGIPETNIMVAASHTHSGPATQFLIAWGERDPEYMATLPGLLVKAALEARDSAKPAKVGFCREKIKNVGVNREQPAFGPIDTAAQLMRIDKIDGTPIAVVYNFGAHAVTRYPYTSRISADWPGLVAAYIKHTMPGVVPLFLQGPCGNINAHETTFVRTDVATQQKVCDMRAGDTAKRFGDQILPALRSIETDPSIQVEAVWKTISLPCTAPVDVDELPKHIAQNVDVADSMTIDKLRPLHLCLEDETPVEEAWRSARFVVDYARHQLKLMENPPFEVEAPLQVLRIGEAVIVGWPGEIFVELGIELRHRSPFPVTFVASLANHDVGYIPPPAAYESQGKPYEFGAYPRCMAPRIYGRLPFRPGVGTILVEDTLRLLNGLHEQGLEIAQGA